MLPSISPRTSTRPVDEISPVMRRSAPRTERVVLEPAPPGRCGAAGDAPAEGAVWVPAGAAFMSAVLENIASILDVLRQIRREPRGAVKGRCGRVMGFPPMACRLRT
jgi:hypothetical protein